MYETKILFFFKMSEKYKYSSKGKTYTYDLSPLTDEERKKFHKMSHTNRLRFIEQHKLEEVPLLDTYTVRTAAESSDKKKKWKREMDIYNNQFIKNGLEEMKSKSRELNTDNLKKQFTDEQYRDIEKRIKEGYNDFDKLINYYVNQINTLNVESIDTMNTKNLNELKAEQINKLVFDTKQLDELLKDPIDQLIKIQDLDKIKDNVKALEAIDQGNISKLINELKNMNLDSIVNNINDKINTALEQLKKITKIDITSEELMKVLKNETDRTELKEMIDELKKQNEAVNKLMKQYNESKITKEQLEQSLSDIGLSNKEIKKTLERIENKADYVVDMSDRTVTDLYSYKEQIDTLNKAINIINEYKQGEIDKKELKQQLNENEALRQNDIKVISDNTKQLSDLTKQIELMMMVYQQQEELIQRWKNNTLNFNNALSLIENNIKILFNQMPSHEIPFNNGLQSMRDLDFLYYGYNPYFYIITESSNIILNDNSNSLKQGILKAIRTLCINGNILLNQYFHDDYQAWFAANQQRAQTQLQPQFQGQGVCGGETQGGSFKNRFKDFTPDINKLADKIERLQDEVNELKKIKAETKILEVPSRKPDFLSQIKDKPTLKPVEVIEDRSESIESNEYKPIMDILRKRREDIEYSDDDDDDEDSTGWGEGIKNKGLTKGVYRFSELFY